MLSNRQRLVVVIFDREKQYKIVGITYSMDVSRDAVRRTIIGLAPAGYTPEGGLGMSMMSPVDLASLFAPLFVLCGVHNAPDITPTFSYYLVAAAKIWAGIQTLLRSKCV